MHGHVLACIDKAYFYNHNCVGSSLAPIFAGYMYKTFSIILITELKSVVDHFMIFKKSVSVSQPVISEVMY